MAGVYLHIPFCKQACHYCNFHFTTSLRYREELVRALVAETGMRADYAGGEQVATIYFGGGTPSLLSPANLEELLSALRQVFTVDDDAEITLEANPDDLDERQLEHWRKLGVNRLSIGVQSFHEEDLKWMNRAHTAVQALQQLQLAKKYFDNITIDLIYGTPALTDERWKMNVDTALDLGIPHLSCYALTVEPQTPLFKLIQQAKSSDVDPAGQSEQFLLLMKWMQDAGYEHYEISNFALPGWRSRHNSSYWLGEKYIGIGPSAHSFDGSSRQWNIANNTSYIRAIDAGELPAEKETLTLVQRVNEYIMTSLRTQEGIDLQKLSPDFMNGLRKAAERYIVNGLVSLQEDRLVLTDEGKLVADGIAAGLFF